MANNGRIIAIIFDDNIIIDGKCDKIGIEVHNNALSIDLNFCFKIEGNKTVENITRFDV